MDAPTLNPMRREVLKSLAAAGVAVPAAAHAAIPAAAASATATPRRVLPVLAGTALDAAFLAGVDAAAARSSATLLPAHALGAFDAAALAALTPAADAATAIVGLTDSASALLVIDRVRAAGGRIVDMTHHRLASEADAARWAAGLGELAVAQAAAAPGLLGGADDGAAGAAFVAGGVSYMSFTCVI